MCGLFNKLSDPLNVRHTLDYIAADISYLNIYSHIDGQYMKQNRDVLTIKCKI